MTSKLLVVAAITLTGCASAAPQAVTPMPVENTAEPAPPISLRLSKAEIEAQLQSGELREVSLTKLAMEFTPSSESGLVTELNGIISIDGCEHLDITFLADRNDRIYVVTGTRLRHYPTAEFQRMMRAPCGELRYELSDGQTFAGQLLPPRPVPVN